METWSSNTAIIVANARKFIVTGISHPRMIMQSNLTASRDPKIVIPCSPNYMSVNLGSFRNTLSCRKHNIALRDSLL
jgi:hypothetical protein